MYPRLSTITRSPMTAAARRRIGSARRIVDRRGYILTNNHVVEQATKIQVQLNGDSTKYTAKVVGVDEDTDLAVIKIDTQKTCLCQLGNSDGVQVGDWCWRLAARLLERDGNGGNYQRQGPWRHRPAVSALPANGCGHQPGQFGRAAGGHGRTSDRHQHRDHYRRARVRGRGFCHASTTALSVYDQIVKNGRVTRGSIGVSFQEEQGTNQMTLKYLGAPYGVVIQGIEPGSPAEKGGVEGWRRDYGHQRHGGENRQRLVNPIAGAPIGSRVKITYYRDKQQRETSATVEDRTRVFPNAANRINGTPDEPAPAEFGLHVESLTPERAQRVGMEGQKGVVVSEVEPASFADDLVSARRRHRRGERPGG